MIMANTKLTNTVAIAEIHKDIQYIKERIDDGFCRVTERQDIANGKLMRHETCIAKQQLQLDDLFRSKLDKSEMTQHEYAVAKSDLSLKRRLLSHLTQAGITALIVLVLLHGKDILPYIK